MDHDRNDYTNIIIIYAGDRKYSCVCIYISYIAYQILMYYKL